MKRIKFYLNLCLKAFQRYLTSVLVITIVVLIGLFLFIKFAAFSSRPVVIEGIVGTYTQDNLPSTITNLLSQSLISIDPSGRPYPNLASGWQANSDASEYTLTLKDNLFWSDGTPLRAQDLNLNVADATVSATDNKTLTFSLNDSFSPFPALLANPVFKQGSLVGTGPYKLNGITISSVFIERVNLTSLRSDLPDVVIKFYPNDETAKQALERGDVQSLVGVNNLADFASQPPFAVFGKTNFSRVVTVFYNTSDKTLSDRNLRLALSFAAPEIKGETTAVSSIPNTSWVFNPDVRDYLNNPEQTKLYLDKVKDASASVTLTSTEPLEGVGKQVVDAWNKAGIKATLRVESGVPQNFQALLIAQDIPLDPDQYSLWHSTQTATNISHISSPRIDQDLEDGRKTTDPNLREAKYQDFQKVLLDEAPATFLYFPSFEVVSFKKTQTNLEKVLRIQFPNLGF